MKRTAIFVLTFALLGFAAPAGAEESPLSIGAKAPLTNVKMKNAADQKPVSIADVAGKKGTLVVFTCNNCPYAKAWEERIVKLGHDYAGKGVGVILINPNDPGISKKDSPEAMQERAKERGMKMPYVIDEGSSLAKAFGATKTPEAFLLDNAGKVVYHGAVDDNHKAPEKVEAHYLKDALEAVSTGKAPAVKQTKSVGCGIKFAKVS